MRRTRTQNALHVQLVAGPAQKLASGDMTQNSRVRVLNGLDDTVRLLFAAHPEFAVHTGDDQIEAIQNVLRVIERAVTQNVGLNSLEDAKLRAEAVVEPLDLRLLRGN